MSRDPSGLPAAEPGRDPVADFFDRERAHVRELPAGADRWESILAESHRPVRHHWLPYLTGAAVLLVAAGVVWGTGRGPGTERAVAPANTSASAASAATVTIATPTAPSTVGPAPSRSSQLPSTTSVPGPLRVPSTFSIVSMSNADGRHLFALGSASCPKGACTAVIGSDDNGATWTTRSSFEALTSPGSRTTPDRARQLVGIRFANEKVGYVYGSSTMRTVDGGRSWTEVDVDRRTVLSLETDGSRVWMATATSCRHAQPPAPAPGRCVGLQPRTGSVRSATTTPVPLTVVPTEGDAAWVTLDGGDAYYNVTAAGATGPARAARLSGSPGALPQPRGCGPATGMWVTATANAPGTLVAVCPSAGKPTQEYSVAVSSDSGTTWSTRPAPGLGQPTADGLWLTATDATHLVAVRRGLPTSSGLPPAATELLSSADGGATWQPPAFSPAGRTAWSDRTAWAGAAGGPLVYAVAGGGSYWVSNDSGATFEAAPLRR